jgi:hypothetical protein
MKIKQAVNADYEGSQNKYCSNSECSKVAYPSLTTTAQKFVPLAAVDTVPTVKTNKNLKILLRESSEAAGVFVNLLVMVKLMVESQTPDCLV